MLLMTSKPELDVHTFGVCKFMDNRQSVYTQYPHFTPVCLFVCLFVFSFPPPPPPHLGVFPVIFGLMPFGWLCTRMLPRFYKTHDVGQDWEAV